MSKPQLTAITTNRKEETHHFFVSSVASWKVGYDVEKLIRDMKKEGYPFNVWMVPGETDEDYQIANYAPQVSGAVWVIFYGYPSD